MEIQIKDTEVTKREIKTKRGTSLALYEQKARIAINDEVRNIVITKRDPEPYPPGKYSLHESSFYVDQYNALKMRSAVLVPNS